MAYDLGSSRFDLGRLYNPWEQFTQRAEKKHNAEDVSRLWPTQNLPQATSSAVINRFMGHESGSINRPVPRRKQILRDFLTEATVSSARSSTRSVEDDIKDASSDRDIALLDDRQNHPNCAKTIEKPCDDCVIYSKNLLIPELYSRLKENRRRHKAERRIIFIPNLTSASALALVATVAKRTTEPLRDFVHRYLGREHRFAVSTSWGFFLEFHIPYHAMRQVRQGPPVRDKRNIHNKALRTAEELPLRRWSSDEEDLYFYEAQTSSLSLGPDEWFWTEYFLVDTYFGSETTLHKYLTSDPPGEGSDPPLGGLGELQNPCFNPREYWLRKVDRRMHQATTEYTALIETFDKRMQEYAIHLRRVFDDDPNSTHTRTLSNVIETIHTLADCISATLDAWEIFSKNQLAMFTTFAREKPEWLGHIDSIVRNMAELDRLRKLLLTKRGLFQFKLNSVSSSTCKLHTVSNLSQTETAISQGVNIQTLTQMTVYIAFPLLFTTALFSMEFMQPKLPWLVFFAVLMVTTVVNYVVASYITPARKWLDRKTQVAARKWHR